MPRLSSGSCCAISRRLTRPAWPVFDEFNWASDYFDVIALGNDRPALRVVDDVGQGETLSFAELRRRSSQVANWRSGLGLEHGDLADRDVFKSSDYRISPFELESVLIEHVAVAEAAVVPSPDPLRLAVPKAFVTLVAGHSPDADTTRSIFGHIRSRVSAYKRIRRPEFNTLPKTISGKIRRVELCQAAQARPGARARNPHEFREEDFSEFAAQKKP